MIFWILVGLITIAVLAAMLWPLLRGRARAGHSADYDIEVYRDQLAEVERNLDRGLIGEHEAEAAKAEIGRRILAADQARQRTGDPGGARAGIARRALAAVLLVAVPAGAVALYLQLGSPGMESRPFAARDVGADPRTARGDGDATRDQARDQAPGLEQSERQLAQRLQRSPGDAAGWRLLGRTRMAMQRFRAAAEAFARARELRPDDPGLAAMHGEALVMAAGGTVTEKARAALDAAVQARPDAPRPRYYLALARLQQGDAEAALRQWADLVADAAPDAPWLAIVEEQMAAAERQLGREPGRTFAEVAPAAPAAAEDGGAEDGGASATAGPTREQMQAAQDMEPEARRRMIRGMVEDLAARLESEPRDARGWQRLIRSYGVLGESAKAQRALETALDTFAKAPFVRRQLVAQARRQGLTVPRAYAGDAGGDGARDGDGTRDGARDGDGSGRRGPTAEQAEAAQDMPAEERRQMIAGMVNRLAERLEQDPDDLEGWLMLARSYRVLEQPAKARDALAEAAELAPENVEVLARYARAIRAAAGDRPTAESYAVTRRILELDPDNPQALWFTALHHAAEGRRDKARELFDRALAQLPADAPQTAELRRRAERMLAR